MLIQIDITGNDTQILNQRYPNCILTLSPKMSYSNTGKLKPILAKLLSIFRNVLVVDSTYNDRWNLYIKGDFNSIVFEQYYLKETEKITKRIKTIRNNLDKNGNISFLNWKSTIHEPEYLLIHSNIKQYMLSYSQFLNDITSISEKYFINRINNNFDRKEALTYSINYLLEEISMIIFLYNNGYEIEVYPGEDLIIFRNIVEKIYPHFPYNLDNRKHFTITIS
jgi:hypothetical protein